MKRTQTATIDFKEIIESAPDAIVIVDPKGIIGLVNYQAEKLFGYSRKELMGEHVNKLIPTRYHEIHDSHRAEYGQAPQRKSMSSRKRILYAQSSEGSQIPVDILLSPIRHDEEIHTFCAIRDISKKKQTEEDLRAVVEAADELLACEDMDFFYRRAVELARERLGVERCAIFLRRNNHMVGSFGTDNNGKTTDERSFKTKVDSIWKKRFRLRKLGDPKWTVESEELSVWDDNLNAGVPTGKKDWIAITPIQSSNKPVQIFGAFTNDSGISSAKFDPIKQDIIAIYCSLLGNIAQRKIAEKELEKEKQTLAKRVEEKTRDLKQAMDELQKADKSKDEFFAYMSHDLRTPLNNIISCSEVLRENIHGPLTEKQREYLGRVDDNGYHLLSLLDQILDLSKIQAQQLELNLNLIDIESLCDTCLQMVTNDAQKKELRVNKSFDSRARVMIGDELRIKRVIINLLSNAIKYTPKGGTIGFDVETDLDNKEIKFTIWDEGIGISSDDQQKIFEPFYRVSSSTQSDAPKGIGLGLALTFQLIQLHNGGIEVKSEEGKGSRFIVTLPWQQQSENENGSFSKIPAAQLGIESGAFIVEDSILSAEKIQHYLSKLNIKSQVHHNGKGVLQATKKLHPSLILLDIYLPDIEGWEILREIKGNPSTQSLPVVIISVNDEEEKAMHLGADAFILKPINFEKLQQCLQKINFKKKNGRVSSALLAISDPKILLVEDNEESIKMMSDYLHAKGFHLTIARNGKEGLECARKQKFSTILMDITMPHMDGLEAIVKIRKRSANKEVPIIAVTALAMSNDKERCIKAGANDYMSKPVRLRVLVEKINKFLLAASS